MARTMPTTITAPAYLATATEAQFQRAVVEAATVLGWIAVAIPNMIGNPTGWPDLILIGHGRVMFRELKTERGKLSPKQRQWLERLQGAGADAALRRPADWELIVAELRR